MVNSRTAQLDETFFALSDPTRRALIARLAQGSASVGTLAQPFDLSAPAISKHLRVLERAGLLVQERRGKQRHCRLVPAPLREAMTTIQEISAFWDDRLAQLKLAAESHEIPPIHSNGDPDV